MYCRRVELVSNERISERYFRIAFECEEIAREARPGQFLMVRLVDPAWEYLLSRPLSLCKVEGARIELLFNVIGKGTKLLSQVRKGDMLEILGPLGKGFTIERVAKPILVGGGMGIAPLPFLASEIAKSGRAAEMAVFLGARTAAALCLQETFAALGATVKVATDDGSAGHEGPVTELLEEELNRAEQDRAAEVRPGRRGTVSSSGGRKARRIVYACGPTAMLKTIARLTREHGVGCQVSVEERMGCGVGACMSCACKTRAREGREHFKRVCVEGPVFDAEELVFDED